jgi:hypothetical protein
MKTFAATLTFLVAGLAQAQVADPMRPPGAGAPRVAAAPRGPAAIRLEGILQNGASRVAIVNGQVVREGAQVAGAVIVTILADGIRYSRAGREQVLMLPTNTTSVRVAQSLEAKKP